MTSSSLVPSALRGRLRSFGWLTLVAVAVLSFLVHWSWRTYSVHAVLSGSMGRAAPRGSLILSKRLPAEAYTIGDIVVFPLPTKPSETITHRIVRIEEGKMIQTQGDANPNGDGWNIPTNLVIGKIIGVVPLVGYLCIALQSAVGFLFLALTTLVLVVLPLIQDAWRYHSKEREGLA